MRKGGGELAMREERRVGRLPVLLNVHAEAQPLEINESA